MALPRRSGGAEEVDPLARKPDLRTGGGGGSAGAVAVGTRRVTAEGTVGGWFRGAKPPWLVGRRGWGVGGAEPPGVPAFFSF